MSSWLFPPGDTDWRTSPPSLWRIQKVLLDSMCFSVTGGVPIEAWYQHAHQLQRHLFNTPRRRPMQQARVFAQDLPPLTQRLS